MITKKAGRQGGGFFGLRFVLQCAKQNLKMEMGIEGHDDLVS